jgi:hypothetical protein
MKIMLMIFPFVCLLMAAFLFGLGGTVLARRKPLVMSFRWFFSVMVLAFAPYTVLLLIDILTQDPAKIGHMWFLVVSPLMFLVLLLFSWIQMQGYMLLGVTDETVRDALHYGLQELKTPYKELLTKITLPELNTELQVSVQSWMGTGQIKMKDRSKRAFLSKLMRQMRLYFENHDIPIRNITAIFYLILGGFVLIFAIAMVLIRTVNC